MNNPQTTISKNNLEFDVRIQRAKVNEWKARWRRLQSKALDTTTVMSCAECFDALVVERRILFYMEMSLTSWEMHGLGDSFTVTV